MGEGKQTIEKETLLHAVSTTIYDLTKLIITIIIIIIIIIIIVFISTQDKKYISYVTIFE